MKLRLDTISNNLIEQLYDNTYIVDAISTDSKKPKPVEHPLVEYYGAFKDSEFMGAFMYIQYSKEEIELHSLLFKKALKYSRNFGKMIIAKAFENKNITRITANIYGNLKKAQNYVLKLGFKLEGIKKNSSYKDKKLIDTYIYGLTRSDYECGG